MDKSITEEEILEELIYNHENHSENPLRYVYLSDIAEKYRVSRSTVTRRIKEMEERGLVRLNTRKTKLLRSITRNKNKVYTITREGIKYGGLFGELQRITEGPSNSPLNSSLSLCDLHGDLSISFRINETPDRDPFEWKTNKLNNGVTQKIRTIFHNGEKISIELFEGSKSSKVVLKPTLIAERHDTPEDLLKAFKKAAYGIRRDFERAGYRLGIGTQKGEGKFTLRSEALKGIGYHEGENILIDKSKGETEVHPRTGDIETNITMTGILNQTEVDDKKYDLLSDEEKIEMLEEVAELSTMIRDVKQTKRRVERTDKKANLIADHVGDLARSVNKLMNMLEGAQEQPEPDFDVPDEPQGGMYG